MSKFLVITLGFLLAIISGCTHSQKSILENIDPNINLGITYLQQGNREKARTSLNQALKNAPDSAISWLALAYLEEVCGNLAMANRYYQHAIKLAPGVGDVHNNYGAYLCRHQQPQAGIQQFLFATQLPSYSYQAAAWENAGLCALLIPDRPAAIHYFQTALRNDPNRPVAKTQLKQILNKAE